MAKKYRFSWDAFDDGTVVTLARDAGLPSDTQDDPRTWLAQEVPCPNQDFVRQVKKSLENTWLLTYPGTPNLAKRLKEAGIGPIMARLQTPDDYVSYIRRCRNTKTTQLCILEALLRYGDQDTNSTDAFPVEGIPRFALLEPCKQHPDTRKPYDYQQDAWNSLSAHLADAQTTGVFQGLLVMPTGSGKTYTAARWLTENILNRGHRLIWLAHRYELLEQAALEFHALAGLAQNQECLRVRIVSGVHCTTSQIDPADNVIIASVNSLARRHDLIEQFLSDPKTFLVIDEAHHSVANSYRALIAMLGAQNQKHLLGLTATPTRTAAKERGTLSHLFGDNILFQTSIQDLIERQFLARPIPVRVSTQAKVEQGVTPADEKHLARFNDLSEAWLERIAEMKDRNNVIVQHYIDHRTKYGKTLIFAISVPHAALLTEWFKTKGVKADYIASYRLGNHSASNSEILQKFRNGVGDDALDVLINVQMLTEGIDIPQIQTVFLTRPTVSEILLRQMIGRALRGVNAGGTNEAFIVSFEDHWERFREWQSPLALIEGDILPLTSTGSIDPSNTSAGAPSVAGKILELLPWELIREFAATIAQQGPGFEADVFEAIPNGWMVLSRDQDGEDLYQVVPVYEHQRPCWDDLINYLWSLSSADRESFDDSDTYDDFFFDCDHPWPSAHDVNKVVQHWLMGGNIPDYNHLQERDECDPFKLADKIHIENLPRNAASELIHTCYTPLAQAIYPTLRSFQAAVDDALFELDHPNESNRRHRAIPIFNPGPDEQLAPGPHHNLQALLADVMTQAPDYLGVSSCPQTDLAVEWTRNLVKGWYAQAYWTIGSTFGSGKIRVNSLLNSPDVPADVIRFLLWHEYLHLYLQQGHTSQFRALERKWPTYLEGDRFLDNLNEKFWVQYW